MRTELLLDPRTGIVTDLSTVALGGGPHTRQATVSETAHFGLPSGGPATSGCSWGEPAVAARAAVAEAVERYCGHLVAVDRLRRGSFREWRAGGLDAVDPSALALYRPGQLARPGFPFAGLGAADEVAWVEGHDLAGNPVLVPAALVWLAPGAHSAGRGGRQVVLPVNAGIAAGPTLGAACRAALAEVAERHSLAQAWHGGARFVPIDAGPAGGEAWAVPNRFAAAVVVSVLHDRDDKLLGVGCATGSTWDQAAAKAGLESALMVDTARRVAAGMAAWERPDGPLAPHRPDRRYASSYQPDLLDVTDTTCSSFSTPQFAWPSSGASGGAGAGGR